MAIKFLSDTTHKKGDIHLDGTSSERLDLDSGVKITGQYKANGNTEYTYINMYNGGDASINIGTKHNLGYISFESGNGAYTERMRITNTGKIGIGTTSPAAELHVNGSGNTGYLHLTNSTSGSTINDGMTVGVNSSNYFVFVREAAPLYFGTNATERMRITSDGKVGVGTTSPQTKLHIEDSNPFLTLRGNNTSYTNAGIQLISGNASNSRGLGVFHYVENSDVEWFAGLPYSSNDAYVINRNTGYTVPSSQSSPPGKGASQGRLLTINSSGNVGIGTDSPSTKLHVNGTVRVNNEVQFTNNQMRIYRSSNDMRLRTGSSDRMTITSTGSVGIGTTSPSHKLQVAGNIYANAGQIYIDNGYYLSGGDATSRIYLGNDGSQGVQIFTDSTERIRIADGGNVGIGTTSPSSKLHVAGAIKTTGDVTMSSNTTLHIGNVDLTTGSGGNTVSVEAATSSGTAMNFKTSSGTVAAYMVYQGTTTTRFAGRVEPSGNRTLDLGTDALRWRVVYCETLDSAGQHESNLQDREQPVGQYITGTVLAWKNGKNRPCTQFADHMRMGIAVLGQDSPLVQGAEPVLCTGIVEEGDYLVTSEKEGHAVAIPRHIVKEQLLFDCVIGKALQDGEGESHLIKTWINI